MKSISMLFIILGSLIVNISCAQSNPSDHSILQKRVISLDFNQTKGHFNTMFKACVGAGRANEGLRADWQQQLALVKKECDFKYIRMHGLLTDDMGVYSEDRQGNLSTISNTSTFYMTTSSVSA